MTFLKYSAAFVAALTMTVAPLAQGAEAKTAAKARVKTLELNYNIDKKAMQDYLKYTGLATKKRMTVGEFHSKMRPFYPRTLRAQMDEWVRMNRNELMPELQVSTYKDTEGKEQVRLLANQQGQSFTVSYNPENNAKFMKFNNVFLTRDDIKYHEQGIRKIIHGNPSLKTALNKTKPKKQLKTSIVLGYEEYSRLTARQRAEYMLRVRYVLENAERVMASYYGNQALNDVKKEFFVQWLLLEQAQAKNPSRSIRGAKPGDPCIVSGYLATYGNDYSCGGTGPGRAKLIEEMNQWGGGRCTNGSVSCNPLVYGFKNGQAICVKNAGKNSEIYSSTSQACPNASPLRKGTADEQADKKRIIESYLGEKDPEMLKQLGVDGLAFTDGKIPKEQYDLIAGHLADLNKYIDAATNACAVAPLSEIQKIRAEQESACQALALRKIELDSYPMTPIPIPVPPIAAGPECGNDVDSPRNSESVNGKCECRAGDVKGSITEDGKEIPACLAAGVVAVGDDTKQECNKDQKPNPEAKEGEDPCKAASCTWCKWAIGIGVFALVAGAVWWMSRDDNDSKKPATDPDPCPPAPLVCLPPVTPVATPTPTPPPIQTPPVTPTATPTTPGPVPTPAVTPYVEPTGGTSTSTSGGVR